LDSTLQQDQESWVRAERVMESPILVNALELLGGGSWISFGSCHAEVRPRRRYRAHYSRRSRIRLRRTTGRVGPLEIILGS
jgi:hypothetical protein